MIKKRSTKFWLERQKRAELGGGFPRRSMQHTVHANGACSGNKPGHVIDHHDLAGWQAYSFASQQVAGRVRLGSADLMPRAARQRSVTAPPATARARPSAGRHSPALRRCRIRPLGPSSRQLTDAGLSPSSHRPTGQRRTTAVRQDFGQTPDGDRRPVSVSRSYV
jgi:hypothetical protein